MKHHPDLFDARTLYNDTRLLFQLKLLLGTVCAYGGEVPIPKIELAKRLGTSSYRVTVLLQKLIHEGVVHYDERGVLFFDRHVFVSQNKEDEDTSLYAKNFRFFNCPEFLNEDRNTQRLVLHYVGKELVYLPGNFRWGHISDLYGPFGLLNIPSRKAAFRILEKASKYLHIKIHKDNYQVTGVQKTWLDMGEVHSEGAELWVFKQLKKHRFCCEFISRKAVWQIAKVMEDYYVKFGYTYAVEIFDMAFSQIQKNTWKSHRFLKLIYKGDEEYLINEEENELDEISAYFRSVMESAELNCAVQLSMDLEVIREKKEFAETHLFTEEGISELNASLLEEAGEQLRSIQKKLHHIHKTWLQRFHQNKEWFIRHASQIQQLPPPFLEIKQHIKKLFSQKPRFS